MEPRKLESRLPESPRSAGETMDQPDCYFTPKEIATLWRVSVDSVVRLFANEPDVLVLQNAISKHRRRYRTLRIPHSVLVRVQTRRSLPDTGGLVYPARPLFNLKRRGPYKKCSQSIVVTGSTASIGGGITGLATVQYTLTVSLGQNVYARLLTPAIGTEPKPLFEIWKRTGPGTFVRLLPNQLS